MVARISRNQQIEVVGALAGSVLDGASSSPCCWEPTFAGGRLAQMLLLSHCAIPISIGS